MPDDYDSEGTDPSIRNAPVPMWYCKENTGKMLAAQVNIQETVTRIDKKVGEHLSFHNGKEKAKAGVMQSGQFWIRLVVALVMIGALLGGTVWTVSKATHSAVKAAINGSATGQSP